MSIKLNAEVKLETAETLENIVIITEKIKRELKTIKEIVTENGPLNSSINQCNTALCTILEKRGVKVDELLEFDDSNEVEVLQTVSLNVDAITQKLMTFMDK